jgi:Rps23 Pro-64 3,4-dihydroxylase Tpa1-like proline 4-hydroxylase
MSPSFPLRKELFDEAAVKDMRARYLESEPYHHLVIPDLVEEGLLEKTKEELKCGVQATLKETDIYKVYQTGDLANLDGLSKEEKDQLQSLRQLRDALYSVEFRKLVSKWTGTGPLSGSNIDLSVNAYGHTGHLLCHDDVIGTRKVSYILYLVDSRYEGQ